jgi:hypothetical protein
MTDTANVIFKVIIAAAVACVAVACRPARFDAHAREYVRLAVALGERDPDSIDFYYGPPEWVVDIRKSVPRLEDIRRSALKLEEQLKSNRDERSVRLASQVRAVATRAGELLGSKKTFEQEALDYFGLTIPEFDPGRMNPTRTQLDRLLAGSGPLAARYAAFDEKFLVPSDRLPAVMARAIQGCRDQTLSHLRLPAGEGVTVEYVQDKPWSAFSRYQGNFRSVIQVNADLALTVDRVLQLACHEGYPGHHAQNVLQEIRFVRDLHRPEWMVQPTFSPQSLVSEALATFAVNVAFPETERLRFERDALFPLAGLDPKNAAKYDGVERLIDELHSAEPAIARDFLDGKLEWARAAAALEQQVLMAHPEQTLKYISEYRSYMITYTLGRDLVAKLVSGWPQFEQLMTDPDAAALLCNVASRSMMKQ